MKRAIVAAAFAITVAWTNPAFEAAPGFEKVSDHCYYLRLAGSGKNIGAVITAEGILIINPPTEPDLSALEQVLTTLTSQKVRWVAFTDHHFVHSAGTHYFADRGAVLLASARLRALTGSIARTNLENPAVSTSEVRSGSFGEAHPFTWLVFDHQMRLFPEDMEIRLFAVEQKARTGGDVVVFVPDEKVLFVGDLYEPTSFSDIDISSEGNALGWIDGLKQIIESVPLLKPAIKPPISPAGSKTEPEEEKTLEEEIVVVSANGEASNLQDMKNLLDASQKLRKELSRVVALRRTLKSYLASADAKAYQSYRNFESYAVQLFEALSSLRADQRK